MLTITLCKLEQFLLYKVIGACGLSGREQCASKQLQSEQ